MTERERQREGVKQEKEWERAAPREGENNKSTCWAFYMQKYKVYEDAKATKTTAFEEKMV